jgi:hypothetical protein
LTEVEEQDERLQRSPEGAKAYSLGREPQEKERPHNPKAPKGRQQTMASSLTNLLYHIVFSTKERVPLIDEGLQESLYEYIGGIMSTCW